MHPDRTDQLRPPLPDGKRPASRARNTARCNARIAIYRRDAQRAPHLTHIEAAQPSTPDPIVEEITFTQSFAFACTERARIMPWT